MTLFKLNKKRIIFLISACCLFICLFLLGTLLPQGTIFGGEIDYLITFIGSLILLSWGITIINRIQYKKQKYILIAIIVLIYSWIMMRFIKWLPNIHFLSIYIDYLYYVPTTLLPTLFIALVLETFFSSFKYKKYLYISLFVIAVIFIILVMTNELHFLFYKDYSITHPSDHPEIEKITSSYGLMYYIHLGYVIFLVLTTIVIFIFGSRKQLSFKQILIPLFLMVLFIAYLIIYAMKLFGIRQIMILKDFAFISAILLTTMLESLLDIGLIQNNGQYYKNFKKSSLEMCIYDENNKPLYKTDSYQEKRDLENKRYIEKTIGLYQMVLAQDISGINTLQKRIIEENKKIEDVNKKLATLIDINKEQSSISYRLRFSEDVENSIKEVKDEVNKLISSLPNTINETNQKEVKRYLGEISFLLGYMKQKCMLLLEAQKEQFVSNEALKMILNVVSQDIKSGGFNDVAYNLLSKEETDIKYVSLLNDFIVKVVKEYEFLNCDLLIIVDVNHHRCRLMISGNQLSIKDIQIKGMNIKSDKNEDGLIYEMEPSDE